MKILLSIFCLLILVSCSPQPSDPEISFETKTTSYDSGGVRGETNYKIIKKGKETSKLRHGTETGYDEEGNIAFILNYKDDKKDGPLKRYSDGRIYSYKDGNRDVFIEKYLNSLTFITHYIDGEEDGVSIDYYNYYKSREGVKGYGGHVSWGEYYIRKLTTYKKGKKHGQEEEYVMTENDKHLLVEKRTYNQGKVVELESYWENGFLKGKGKKINNKKNGVEEYFYENGRLKSRKEYEMGMLDGTSEEYWRDGDINVTRVWKKGKKISDSDSN